MKRIDKVAKLWYNQVLAFGLNTVASAGSYCMKNAGKASNEYEARVAKCKADLKASK